ncbi:hypothetical protein QMA56_01855 [Leuconostoc falkenbergense]|uniref:hypothetical protein n=1 Tax=Leuconostoc falkenbergense TaxID=2766470 RepID=UPI0024AE82BC|nr:hypothetical protein [Leuconostoc falkenbergense]MDI6666447.1 hypothetical protein [Leuconostoc falkenbergense]
MNYEEIAAVAVKPALKPFEAFTKNGPASLNGYVAIPDNLPLDYFDKVYDEIDQAPIGGLTFGGYFTEINKELSAVYLDQSPFFNKSEHSDEELALIEKIKSVSVRALGFDNNHIWENEMAAAEGAEYLSKQLKKLKVSEA